MGAGTDVACGTGASVGAGTDVVCGTGVGGGAGTDVSCGAGVRGVGKLAQVDASNSEHSAF